MTRLRLIIIGAIVVAALLGLWSIRNSGEKAGAAKVTQAVERQRTERVAEARVDERTAAVVSDSISRRVARADDLSTQAVKATIKDLRDAIDNVPPAAAGASPPAAPVDSLRDTLNAGIARANRAAGAAPAGG
jgi:FtsZ-interacting cell division protein ZipA